MTSPKVQKQINTFYDHFTQVGISASSDTWVATILNPRLTQQSTAKTILIFVYNFCFEGTIPEVVDLEKTYIDVQKILESAKSSPDFANKAQFVAGVLTQLKKNNDPKLQLLKRINTVAQKLTLKDRTETITQDALYLADKIFEKRALQIQEVDNHKSAFVRASDDQRESFQKTVKSYLAGGITLHNQAHIEALEKSAASFEAQSPIQFAADDVLRYILRMLDPKSLSLIAQTCKRVKGLASCGTVIFNMVKTRFPNLLRLSSDQSKERIASLFNATNRQSTLFKKQDDIQKIPIVSEILLGGLKHNRSFRVSLLTETASFFIMHSTAHKLLIWIDKKLLQHRHTATMPEGSFLNSAYAEGDALHILSNKGVHFTWNITEQGVIQECIEDFRQYLGDRSHTKFYFAPNSHAHRPRIIKDNGSKLSCFDLKENNAQTPLEEVTTPKLFYINNVTPYRINRSRAIPHRLRVHTRGFLSKRDYSIFDLFSGQELISISSSEKYIGDTGKIFVTQGFWSRVIRLYDREHEAKEPFMEFEGLSLNISSFLIQEGIFCGLLYESDSGYIERDLSSLSYKKLAAFWDLKTGKLISTLDLTATLDGVPLEAAKFFALRDCIYLIRASGDTKLVIHKLT
jgi:hypothetical protein